MIDVQIKDLPADIQAEVFDELRRNHTEEYIKQLDAEIVQGIFEEQYLSMIFVWKDTLEGYDYWKNINNKYGNSFN